jgi:hypothetical protein
LGAHKVYKIQKQIKDTRNVFKTFNNTIHKAAPLIDYAVDAASARLAKVFFILLYRFNQRFYIEKTIYITTAIM